MASSTSDACPTNFNRDRDIAIMYAAVDGASTAKRVFERYDEA